MESLRWPQKACQDRSRYVELLTRGSVWLDVSAETVERLDGEVSGGMRMKTKYLQCRDEVCLGLCHCK